MKLFFETSTQAAIFLMMLPVGMLFAVCVDLCSCAGGSRPLWDLLAVLICFLLVGVCVVLLNDATLRMYHILSVIAGYLLYTCGIRKVVIGIVRLFKVRKKDTDTGRKTNGKVE